MFWNRLKEDHCYLWTVKRKIKDNAAEDITEKTAIRREIIQNQKQLETAMNIISTEIN